MPLLTLQSLIVSNFRRQKEILAPFLTAARMIPLRIDIWHNLERIFLAGLSGDDESEVEADRYAPQSPLTDVITYIISHSGFTTQEKELYARILDLIPMLVPVIEGCIDKEREFSQFVKFVRHCTFIYISATKSGHKISESALNSRTSDMHTVKEKVLLYLPATTSLTRLKLDFAVSTDLKTKRGWNDPQCALLLIPPRFQDEFFAGPL
jgi:hypothetical protein